ncbi:MAG: GAF domain-containing protein, partial [Leptolyngbya sp. SIO1D8]|nr:GAF domain-containing protein [Leptolyngbya sp. SIO1D8]
MASHPESGCILALYRRKVVGIATRQDLMQAIAQNPEWSHMRLSQVVNRPVITISEADLESDFQDGSFLVNQFTRHQIRYLPVVDKQARLVGLIDKTLLLQQLHTLSSARSTIPESTSPLFVSSDELYRQNQRVHLLAELALKIRQSLQLKDILHTTVTEVQRLLNADRVLIYQVLADGTGKPISEAVIPPYPPILGYSFPEEVFPEEYQTLYAQGRVLAISDVHAPNSGLAECLVEFIEQWGIQSKLIVPIV